MDRTTIPYPAHTRPETETFHGELIPLAGFLQLWAEFMHLPMMMPMQEEPL